MTASAPVLAALGFYTLAGQPASSRDLVAEVVEGEALGLGTAFISERYNKKEAATLSGAAGAVSERITIATAATNHNTRHPLVTAGFARTMQSLTGGRFVLGLGRGIPMLQDAFGIPRITTAQLEDFAGLVRRLFRGEVIVGHNTDGIGITRDLVRNLGVAVSGARVLLMGAGGASYGVMEPLLRERPQAVVVANRTLEKAVALTGHFEAVSAALGIRGVRSVSYERLEGERFDLVINATSAGLEGAMPPLPQGIFAPGALAYDMTYGPGAAPFLALAREGGAARVADGLGMLVEQAAESFFIWRGVRPDTAPVLAMLRAAA